MIEEELTILLNDLSAIFPIASTRDEKKVIEQYVEYLMKCCKAKCYKIDRVKKRIIDEYKGKFFPEVGFIRDILSQYPIIPNREMIDEGSIYTLTLNGGYQYVFTATEFGMTLNEIKETATKKYGNDIEIKKYPKDTIFTSQGAKVF